MRTVAAVAAGTRAATKPLILDARADTPTPSNRACQRCAWTHQLDDALSATPSASAHACAFMPEA
jgi:hypothetical protein